MKPTRWIGVLAAGLSLLAACGPPAPGGAATASTALGWRFGPGLSCRAPGLFAAPPVVRHRAGAYALAWTYGKDAFYFQPRYRAVDGRLVFVLQATSSTGSVAGRRTELRIEGAEPVAALQRGGAYWWEPDGTYVTLRIEDAPASQAAGAPGAARPPAPPVATDAGDDRADDRADLTLFMPTAYYDQIHAAARRLNVSHSAILAAAWLGARGRLATSTVAPRLTGSPTGRVYFYLSRRLQDEAAAVAQATDRSHSWVFLKAWEVAKPEIEALGSEAQLHDFVKRHHERGARGAR